MRVDNNHREGIARDIELFHFIKKEAISIGDRYYLLGIWMMAKFFSRPRIEKLVEKEILKRLGLFRKQPKEIKQMFNNKFNYLSNSRSRATILWELDYQRLLLLIQEREMALER
ncbi:MAG: hypothetical protein AAB405_00170 [Patescibacteria group bacterium]